MSKTVFEYLEHVNLNDHTLIEHFQECGLPENEVTVLTDKPYEADLIDAVSAAHLHYRIIGAWAEEIEDIFAMLKK